MRRIKMVLGVAAAMVMMLVAIVAPAMAQTNEFNDSDRYGFVSSGDSDWNYHNDWNDHNDWYDHNAYEDYLDEVEDHDEGSYWGFNSNW